MKKSSNNIFSAAAIGLLSRVTTIVFRFFSLPLTLSVVSKDRYGAWLIILSVVGWLSMSDLGIPSALQNTMIDLRARKLEGRSSSILVFGVKFLLYIGLGVASLFTIFALLAPIVNLLKVSPAIATEVRFALIFCVFSFGLGLPSRIGGVLYNVHGKLQMTPLFELLSGIFSFLMLILAVRVEWNSLFALVACSSVGLLAGSGLATVLAFKRFKYSFSTPPPDLGDKKRLVAKGGFFFLTTIGELLILQSDALLIGLVLGASFVPQYLIPATLFINFIQLQNIWLRPLWPVLTDLYAKKDSVRLFFYFKKTMLASFFVSILFGIFLLVFGDWFIRLWSHNAVGISTKTMALGFALYTIIACIDNILATFINAFGRIEARFIYTLTFGIAKVTFGYIVLKSLANGIQWLPLVYAFTMMTFSVFFAANTLKKIWKPLNMQI